jgi:uncharacterized CHY-type Zn-finger protein
MNLLKRGYRTPRWLMVLKVAQVPWIVVLSFCILAGITPGVNLLFFVLLGAGGLMYGISMILRFMGWVLFRNDPEYRKFRATGGDPYFDLTVPEGINNDSWAVRIGGKPEPKTDFVPPKEWIYQCNACGARNETQLFTFCWHCGNYLGVTDAPATPTVGRNIICVNCKKLIHETNYGDLDRGGVICPYCNTTLVMPT